MYKCALLLFAKGLFGATKHYTKKALFLFNALPKLDLANFCLVTHKFLTPYQIDNLLVQN